MGLGGTTALTLLRCVLARMVGTHSGERGHPHSSLPNVYVGL